jgi:hypothetical protein
MVLVGLPTTFGKRLPGDDMERTLEVGESSAHGALFSLAGSRNNNMNASMEAEHLAMKR